MAYALAYCVHTLEMNALRGWGVAFLGFVAAAPARRDGVLADLVLTALGLIGTAASVFGNEAAIRIGRRRLIGLAMMASIVMGRQSRFVGTLSYSSPSSCCCSTV